jgi:hypothetical protein
MRAVLSTEIPIARVAVFAEMAWMERRPELGLVCRAAREDGRRVSAATVQSVLPGLAEAGARNVIAWCRMLGLCDAQGGLTALGEDVAERDEAPVPEQGVYGFWMAEHPVLGRRILTVERLSSSRDHRFDAIKPLPFTPDRGVVFHSVAIPHERYLLRDLPANHGQTGCLLGETRGACRLRWTLDFDASRDQWQLDGTLEAPQGGMRPIQHETESDGLELWALAASWGAGPLAAFGRWQPKERRLAVALQGLTDDEQDTFRKTFKLREVEVPGKGSYKDVTLEDVPIGPTAEEAPRWALARLDRHLAKSFVYRSRGEVRRLFAELIEGSPLEPFSPTLPAHDALLAAAAQKPALFWSLAAPVDLAPRPVPEDELAVLRVGKSAAAAIPETPGVIRMPHRSGWSMKRLVDHLMAGSAPRSVLLCDRYVRGSENIASLKLFAEAVRRLSPAVQIHVWTGDEEADFKQIQAITGAAPKAYREVFGRSTPHDRYLLVVPRSGEGFGWQLSNSPLHARSPFPDVGPDSALEWRDLTGMRVSADELEPPLQKWLHRGGS